MIDLKDCQQQEMERKLQFHSRLMMAQVLILGWVQFYLPSYLEKRSRDVWEQLFFC